MKTPCPKSTHPQSFISDKCSWNKPNRSLSPLNPKIQMKIKNLQKITNTIVKTKQ